MAPRPRPGASSACSPRIRAWACSGTWTPDIPRPSTSLEHGASRSPARPAEADDPSMDRPFDLLVRNAGTVFTADGPDGVPARQMLAPVPGGAVGILDADVAWLGPEQDLPARSVAPSTKIVDAGGGLVAPGFVDSHTHLVWAGDRSGEFALRCAGADYLSIARAGGGIASTVR